MNESACFSLTTPYRSPVIGKGEKMQLQDFVEGPICLLPIQWDMERRRHLIVSAGIQTLHITLVLLFKKPTTSQVPL